MMADSSHEVTQLLRAWSNGDRAALAKLMPLVYDELRRLARRALRQDRRDHTLQTTALVHELYLRLVDWENVSWQDRAHFLGVAAQLIRRILVDYARSHHAAKRGGAGHKIFLDDEIGLSKKPAVDLIMLDDALTSLATIDPQQSRIVELRFFGGLTIKETAEVLGVSPATIKREWSTAKLWLYKAVTSGK